MQEQNVTGHDYDARGHLRSGQMLFDVHAHVTLTQPSEAKEGEPASLDQAETVLAVAAEFGVRRIWSMCPPEDIPPLRERFGDRLAFNGSISKQTIDEPDDVAYRLLDAFLEQRVEIVKFWSAPRGRDRGLFVDAPWRKEIVRRARAAGVRVFMVHVGDPDAWFRTVYADAAKFGTKADQYRGLRHMLEEFPDVTWIGAHLGGDPEHPDHLEELLDAYPHLHFDTSATKWQVREASAHREDLRAVIERHPTRFLFGSDLVTHTGLVREHYVSRYWCQRTLWESGWNGRSPIADPDYQHTDGEPATPLLRGLDLSVDVLELVYRGNVLRLFPDAGLSEQLH